MIAVHEIHAAPYDDMVVYIHIDYHQWLLGDDVDILPSLLLPLAGPEEFTEEETEQLPIDLQYLPDDKIREEDPDIRRMLLEALTKVNILACNKSENYLVLINSSLVYST